MKRYSDVHTHNQAAGSDAIINLPFGAEVPAEGSYSMGVHPWDTAEGDIDEKMAVLEQALQQPGIVAIGECGLDARQGASLDVQEDVLRRHIALSEKYKFPLILHAVGTHQRLIELRRELRPTQLWIVHGFRGKPQLAQALLRAGFDISIGSKYNPATLAIIPPSRLHHETDTDFSTSP